jgi:hypothetical protein
MEIYTIMFTDGLKFEFTEYQIKLIPYFKSLIESENFTKNNVIKIYHTSIGFEFIHAYVTMDEFDIYDPTDRYSYVLKQCDYFCYDKFTNFLKHKYDKIEDKKPVISNIIEAKQVLTKYTKLIRYDAITNNIRDDNWMKHWLDHIIVYECHITELLNSMKLILSHNERDLIVIYNDILNDPYYISLPCGDRIKVTCVNANFINEETVLANATAFIFLCKYLHKKKYIIIDF